MSEQKTDNSQKEQIKNAEFIASFKNAVKKAGFIEKGVFKQNEIDHYLRFVSMDYDAYKTQVASDCKGALEFIINRYGKDKLKEYFQSIPDSVTALTNLIDSNGEFKKPTEEDFTNNVTFPKERIEFTGGLRVVVQHIIITALSIASNPYGIQNNLDSVKARGDRNNL